jgi:hypothetical protein
MTNLAILKKSRHRLREGDVFVMRPPDGLYLYGRVISTVAKAGWSMPGAILIYVYRSRSSQKAAVPTLALGDLLLPPMMTNRLGWSRGYFETIGNKPLQPGDVLRHHCFENFAGRYFDETAAELPGPIAPVGTWGLHSYRSIDDEISKALGIPLAPS